MVLLLPIINRCIEILSARHGFLKKLFFCFEVAVGHKTRCSEDFLSFDIISVLARVLGVKVLSGTRFSQELVIPNR